MTKTKTNICLSDVFLLISIILFLLYSFWLFKNTEEEHIQEVINQYNELYSTGKKDDAKKLLSEISEFQDKEKPLNIKWLPLVLKIRNGYQRLALYKKILEHSPDKEIVYQLISNFMKKSPSDATKSIKKRYYSDLLNIKGIDIELLNKYELFIDSEDKSPSFKHQ